MRDKPDQLRETRTHGLLAKLTDVTTETRAAARTTSKRVKELVRVKLGKWLRN